MHRIIFLPTIQHTGTWFTMEALKVHPEVDSFIEMHAMGLSTFKGSLHPSTLFEKESFSKDGYTIVHMHLPVWDRKSPLFSSSGGADSIMFVGMMCACPTILPVRDPLLSLITAVNRRTRSAVNYDISYLVRVWCQTVRDFTLNNEVARPFYFPVDLLAAGSQAFRVESLTAMIGYVGLRSNPDVAYSVGRFCKDWPMVRQTLSAQQLEEGFEYESKQKYLEGDVDYFRKEMNVEWARLRKTEPLLRPWLEHLGYRDLIWWSK